MVENVDELHPVYDPAVLAFCAGYEADEIAVRGATELLTEVEEGNPSVVVAYTVLYEAEDVGVLILDVEAISDSGQGEDVGLAVEVAMHEQALEIRQELHSQGT